MVALLEGQAALTAFEKIKCISRLGMHHVPRILGVVARLT